MWHKSILDTVKQAKSRGLCLYGAGFWGEIAYKLFCKMGCRPLCFCDDNSQKHEMKYQGLPVYSLEEAVRRYPDAIYIVCVDVTKKTGTWNRVTYNKMLGRLKEFEVYDYHSELRVLMYIFLLDINNINDYINSSEITINTEMEDIKNLLVLNHMSNSGSYYLEQLLDGHPNILCLPYGGETFLTIYEKRLKYLEGEELLYEMMAQMLGYFHSKYEDLFCVREHKFEEYCVNENGEFINEVLICPEQFLKYLIKQFNGKIKLKSFGHMLKVYVAAYNKCLKKRKAEHTDYWLFFQMHKPDIDITDLYHYFDKNEFTRIENLVIIREPVQQCYSWVRRVAMKQKRSTLLKKNGFFSYVLKSELGIMLEKKTDIDNVRVIRFEDLKYHHIDTLTNLCKWLEIPFSDILLSTTLNGYEIYFPTYTKDGVKYITGNDMTAVTQKDYSEVLTLWDETRLNIIFSKFKQAYGYDTDTPSFTEFNKKTLDEILYQDFKFATIVQEVIEENGLETDFYDVNEYVKDLYGEYMSSYQENTKYYDYIRPEIDER